jgi:hypothetical protein
VRPPLTSLGYVTVPSKSCLQVCTKEAPQNAAPLQATLQVLSCGASQLYLGSLEMAHVRQNEQQHLDVHVSD